MNPSQRLFPEFDSPELPSKPTRSVRRPEPTEPALPEPLTLPDAMVSKAVASDVGSSRAGPTNTGPSDVALANPAEATPNALPKPAEATRKTTSKRMVRKKTVARRNFLADLDAAGKRLDAKRVARSTSSSAESGSRGRVGTPDPSDQAGGLITDDTVDIPRVAVENGMSLPVESTLANDVFIGDTAAGGIVTGDAAVESVLTEIERRSAVEATERETPWSVSELTARIRETLEQNFARVTVVGEISDFAQPRSGHAYFTLKDSTAQISGVIWRGVMQRLRFDLTDGLSVVCHGRLEVYPSRGRYQLIIDSIKPEGLGELELAFRQLHAKLAREGLFDPARKRPIPRWVRRVAVVTSPTGAAIHDFLNVLRRRRRDLEVVIVPVKVQGAGAAEEIADAIDRVNRISEEAALSIEKTVSMEHAMPAEYLPQHGHGAEACTKADGMAKRSAQPFDVLVVTRGGGSLDDLWSFNEECVVRAIARSRLPVISGVGHEIDVTLTDLAADLRALTPSEAAERVAPSADELEKMMRQLGLRLGTALRHRVHLLRRQFDDLASRSCFRDPLRNIRERTRQLDELDGRMTRAVRNRLEMANRDLGTLAARLQSISPLAVLGRGYSLTMTRDGSIVRNVADVTIGMILTTRLNGGVIESRAERIWETSPSQE